MAGDDTDGNGAGSEATNSAYASRQTDSKNRSDSSGGDGDSDDGDVATPGPNKTLSSAVGGGRASEEYEDLEPDDDSGNVADDDEIEQAAAELQDRLGELDVEDGPVSDAEDGDEESEPLENVSDLPDFDEFDFDADAESPEDEESESEDESGGAEPAGGSSGVGGAVAGVAGAAGPGTPTEAAPGDSEYPYVDGDSGEGAAEDSGLEDDVGGSKSGGPGSEASASDGSAGGERDGAATGIEPGGDVESPSKPGEFAATVLDESVIDDRYLSEDGTIDPSVEPPCVPAEAPGDATQIGGFPGYDPDAIENREPIVAQADEGHGFSAAAIESGEVVDDARDEVGTHTIYATNYAPDPGSGAAAHTVDDRELAVAQLSSTVFVQSLGVEVDRMTYDAEANQIVAETVEPDPETDATEIVDLDSNDDYLADVSEDELRDKVAIQLLSGNWDLVPRNVQASEDGTVHIHDRDRAYKEYRHNPYDEIETSARNAEQTAEMINKKAPQSAEEIDLNSEDFAQRTLEIAHELETSGYADQVTENVEEVMDRMAETPHFDESLCQAHERLRENIRKAAVAAEETRVVKERELTSSRSMPGS